MIRPTGGMAEPRRDARRPAGAAGPLAAHRIRATGMT